MTSSAGCRGLIFCGIAAQGLHGVAHGGKVHHRRHAGEVLHQHPGRAILDLVRGLGLGVPVGQGLDVLAPDGDTVFVAQQVLEQDLGGVGQTLAALHRVETKDLVVLSPNLEPGLCLKAVLHESTPPCMRA